MYIIILGVAWSILYIYIILGVAWSILYISGHSRISLRFDIYTHGLVKRKNLLSYLFDLSH